MLRGRMVTQMNPGCPERMPLGPHQQEDVLRPLDELDVWTPEALTLTLKI